MLLNASRPQTAQEGGNITRNKRQICVRAAAVQAGQPSRPDVSDHATQHAEIWQLFCEARAAIGDYSKQSQCIPKAASIAQGVERLIAGGAANLAASAGDKNGSKVNSKLAQVPLDSEAELSALYENIRGASRPDHVSPLASELTVFEKAVFPSAAQLGNTFQGWGTLASPDDIHVLVGHARRNELEAYADAGYHLESSMHDSYRSADDGLACSMYDVLRLYLLLNQLLHNDWDVLECLRWPSDDSVPEDLRGVLSIESSKQRTDKMNQFPPEALMKLLIGSQLHWLGSMHTEQHAAASIVQEGSGSSSSIGGSADGVQIRPQFARSRAWMELGRRVQDRTVTNADVQEFCEKDLYSILVTAGYMLAYDRQRLAGSLPMSVGEEYLGEYVSRDGCWMVGNVVYQVLHLDMRLSVLRPRRGWPGYGYYNDRVPFRFEAFAE